MLTWQLKGIIKGLEQSGIIVKKYDIENHLIYLDIPWIGETSPKETAEKTKKAMQRMVDENIKVRYREI